MVFIFTFSNAEKREIIRIGLTLTYWSVLEQDANIMNYLDSRYANTAAKRSSAPLDGTNVTLDVDITDLCNMSEEQYMHTIDEIALLKRNCFAAAFHPHFEAHRNKSTRTNTVIPFREQETMYGIVWVILIFYGMF